LVRGNSAVPQVTIAGRPQELAATQPRKNA
jgi:hypothetical protein